MNVSKKINKIVLYNATSSRVFLKKSRERTSRNALCLAG